MYKRKTVLFLSLMLCVALVLSLSGTAFAAPSFTDGDFTSTMTITEFEPAIIGDNVTPIYNNNIIVGWNVINRNIYGTLSGDIQGTFIITYSGSLDFFEQGDIEGTLRINMTKGKGKIVYSSFSGYTDLLNPFGQDGYPQLYQDANGYYLAVRFVADQLIINGGTGGYRNSSGSGSFTAGQANPVKTYLGSDGYFHVQPGTTLNLVGTMIRR